MMSGKSQSPDKKMKELVEAYGVSLVARLHELETLAGLLSGGRPFDEISHSLEEIHRLAHKIAGTAAMFGYPSVTDHAAAIESGVRPVLEAKQPISTEQAAAIEIQIAALKKLVSAQPDPGSPPYVQSDATATNARVAEFVILLAPPDETTELLMRQIEESGYRVQAVSGQLDNVTGVGQARARAILLHSALPDAFTICRKLNDVFHQEYRANVPIIFLSDAGDFETHLQAVRSGAKAFVAAPLETRTIVRKIEELSRSVALAPHRVLIVEDDDMPAPQCLEAFAGPGYATRVINESSELLDWLQTFDTELIVMDLSVAGNSGLDLAKVVWQRDNFRHIAMLFLTPGPEFNLQVLQLGLSDEFFFPRPIDIDALRSAATRYLADLRCGRRASNFSDLFDHLDLIGRLQSLSGEIDGTTDDRHSAPPDSEVAPTTRQKVLVVDDDRHLVDAIAIKLSEHGIEVLKAFSGEQGFKVAWEERPDFIVTDYAMPDGTGEYLLNRLKEADDTRHIPVMVLTAHKVDGHKDFALEREFMGRLGAVSYLAKPISLDDLVAEMARFVPLPSSGSP
jgi:DNA-binding response OmpR family regulator